MTIPLKTYIHYASQLQQDGFHGKVITVYEAGKIVHIEQQQGLKLPDIERRLKQ